MPLQYVSQGNKFTVLRIYLHPYVDICVDCSIIYNRQVMKTAYVQ